MLWQTSINVATGDINAAYIVINYTTEDTPALPCPAPPSGPLCSPACGYDWRRRYSASRCCCCCCQLCRLCRLLSDKPKSQRHLNHKQSSFSAALSNTPKTQPSPRYAQPPNPIDMRIFNPNPRPIPRARQIRINVWLNVRQFGYFFHSILSL